MTRRNACVIAWLINASIRALWVWALVTAGFSGFGERAWLLLGVIGLFLVPIAIGSPVTRCRPYEVDGLISRGLSWGLLWIRRLRTTAP